MKEVVAFGEILERQSPVNNLSLVQSQFREIHYGGSEANVASALALYGVPAAIVTKLPQNVLGDAALNMLQAYGLNTKYVLRGGERIGRYLAEPGTSYCSTVCTYDRKHSAIAEASPAEFDWNSIFSHANWFHLSGITPALSQNMKKACFSACKTAQSLHLAVSLDVNYRAALWSKKEASLVLKELCNYVDVLIINEDEAEILGFPAEDMFKKTESFQQIANSLKETYPNLNFIAGATRTPDKSAVYALLYTPGQNVFRSELFPIRVVDPIGAGDAFTAALIYGIRKLITPEQLVNFAAATCAAKHSFKGDFNPNVTRQQQAPNSCTR